MVHQILFHLIFLSINAATQHWYDISAMRLSIEMIEAAPGKYLYSQDEYQLWHHIERGRPPGPFVLRAILGDDFFSEVVAIHLDRHGFKGGFGTELDVDVDSTGAGLTGVKDHELAIILNGVPSVRIVSLIGNNRLTSESMNSFASLSELQYVRLTTTYISREDVKDLYDRNSKVEVWLNGEKIPRE